MLTAIQLDDQLPADTKELTLLEARFLALQWKTPQGNTGSPTEAKRRADFTLDHSVDGLSPGVD